MINDHPDLNKPIHPPNMSFTTSDRSSLSVPIHRKRTATERLIENGDPLIANKKAREAARKGLIDLQKKKKVSLTLELLICNYLQSTNLVTSRLFKL